MAEGLECFSRHDIRSKSSTTRAARRIPLHSPNTPTTRSPVHEKLQLPKSILIVSILIQRRDKRCLIQQQKHKYDFYFLYRHKGGSKCSPTYMKYSLPPSNCTERAEGAHVRAGCIRGFCDIMGKAYWIERAVESISFPRLDRVKTHMLDTIQNRRLLSMQPFRYTIRSRKRCTQPYPSCTHERKCAILTLSSTHC